MRHSVCLLEGSVSLVLGRRGGTVSEQVNEVDRVRLRQFVHPQTEREAACAEPMQQNQRRPLAVSDNVKR